MIGEGSGCSTGTGAGAVATAALVPPTFRECVRRVWFLLMNMETLPPLKEREKHLRILSDPADRRYFVSNPGDEHYALLEWLGARFPEKTIVDIGTYRGASALSLIASGRSPVITVDCYDHAAPGFEGVPGIARVLDDAVDWLDTADAEEIVKECRIIVLDVLHDGWTERYIYKQLEALGFNGILILDDIHLNDPMTRFWDEIDRPKLDLSRIGHHTGTGAVLFEGSKE
jgi:hypothetical protein